MEKLGVNQLRELYLSFFESKGHLRLPSFSLIPQNDKSLLLINAGMAPLKPYFADKSLAPRTRVTTCQKCIRTPDIENIGKTARHGTFFEMLGNFSFGDYFKKEAIHFSWEFLTDVLKIPANLLWPSVYEKDDEAYRIWNEEIGVPADHIVRLGKDDNFWEIGAGPCGPCSEIYFDRGEARGCGKPDCRPGSDCDRFIEIWNNVFSEFNNDGNGNYTTLPQQNIDTGMGLERLAVVMQDVGNLFEIDTVQNIMMHISRIAGVKYHTDEKSDISLRIITDHIRSTTFLVCDGVLPSNEGRGYVLRRLLRRAARHGRLLGITENFLCDVVDTVIEENKSAYPELVSKKDYIKRVIRMEEERFRATIDAGLGMLNDLIGELKAAGKDTLAGEDTFRLYDTYGFPIDLTEEILAEQGLHTDREGFDKYMKEQRERARAARGNNDELAWAGAENPFAQSAKTNFVGYDSLEAEAEVLMMTVGGEPQSSAEAGDEVVILLDKTPFYGEGGGQVGDTGIITGENGLAINVTDTKKRDGQYLHTGKIISGKIAIGDKVEAKIDTLRRAAIARAHSSTHLLQRALRDVVGDHIAQAGSFVEPDHLRFDFTHFEAVTAEELERVEAEVNEAILKALPIVKTEMPIDEAKKLGATALFGEKYGSIVRVVNMGDGYSMEFCGGTHLDNTAMAGLFKITSESSVAAGVRRIEAVTGAGVLALLKEKNDLIAETASALKTSPSELASKARTLTSDLRDTAKKLEVLEQKLSAQKADELYLSAIDVDGVKLVAAELEDANTDILRGMGDALRDKHEDVVTLLATVSGGKVMLAAACGKAALAKGAHAGKLVKAIATMVGGGGGGRPDSATAGGRDASKLASALASAPEALKGMLK
ncbi:MAG: alanine--tRNA ligase [Clostridia bacterium]|nr:alanine--tRNA ligase [Clostridia bacterium]